MHRAADKKRRKGSDGCVIKRTLNDNSSDRFVHAKLGSTRSRVLFRKLSHNFQVLCRRSFTFRDDGRGGGGRMTGR